MQISDFRAAAIVGIAGLMLDPAEADRLRTYAPVGVILFGRNVANPGQLAALTAALRAVLPVGGVIMVDQEGGRVARLRPPGWPAHPAAGAIGALHARAPAAGLRVAWLTGALIGLDCAAMGFDVVCAPVLDMKVAGASDVVGDRSFGAYPAVVATLGAAVADGLLAAGIQPVMKHMPGHGRAQVDSHNAMPEVAGLLAAELAPFAANRSLPWGMTAHVLYRGCDDLPASLSPRIITEIIRGRIGFDGVLCSDDLAMHALSGPPAARALACLAAGSDLALYCTGEGTDTASVLEACPPPTPQACHRLAAARALAQSRSIALDAAELAAERAALLP